MYRSNINDQPALSRKQLVIYADRELREIEDIEEIKYYLSTLLDASLPRLLQLAVLLKENGKVSILEITENNKHELDEIVPAIEELGLKWKIVDNAAR